MKFLILFSLVFALGVVVTSQTAFADETPSPRQQLELGVEPDDIICKENRVLVIRTNDKLACVTERTAEKTGWEIIKTEFNFVPDENIIQIIDESLLPQTPKQELMFAITSDVEFDGELFGYFNPQTVRYPTPYEMSVAFARDHYDVKQAVQDYTSLLASGQLTTNSLLEQLVTSSSVHENAMDYKQWMPTAIPEGFELKWIDINQPEGYVYEDVSTMQLAYIPNTANISDDMSIYDAAEFPMLAIIVSIHPYDDDPFPQKRIDSVTGNGASTDVLIEEKYGGVFMTIVSSPAEPSAKGFSLYLNEYTLEILGKGIPLDEIEKIFLEILERQ